MKHLISLADLTVSEIHDVLQIAQYLKSSPLHSASYSKILVGKMLVMIFEKPSLRTRLAFTVAMTQLGGQVVNFNSADIGLGIREPISDVAQVISGMGDIIMIRANQHETIVQLAEQASIPVINGLSNLEHPCQILADLLTIIEQKQTLTGLTVAFIGDGNNNVTHSLALAAGLMGFHLKIASPSGYEVNAAILQQAKRQAVISGGSVEQCTSPQEAIRGVDVVYTDTWVSMGMEAEKATRLEIFQPHYQVNQTLMKLAKPDAIFMHDLPAYRGYEVSVEVIDGPQSVVRQQAQNRLYAQKAWLLYIKPFLLK